MDKTEKYYSEIIDKGNQYKKVFVKNTSRYYNDVKLFVEIHKQYENQLKAYTSSNFNVFKYISLNENFISDIIVDILQPDGEHGQGFLFLNNLLDMIDSPIRANTPSIKREVHTRQHVNNRRRMDILIDWLDYGIMIENKPRAKDEKDQLKNYAEDLKNRYGYDKFKIIYLSNDGRYPAEDSISEEIRKGLEDNNQFYHFTYNNQFNKWLLGCMNGCKSEKYKWFLNDFTNNLTYNYL